VEEKDPRTGKKKRKQVWPRFHQLQLVRQALADVAAHGAGKRYLIQHSAGSGKSNSIAWLAHQLIGLKRNSDAEGEEIFHSVIVVTDRRILDWRWRQSSSSGRARRRLAPPRPRGRSCPSRSG
jgi:type I restriction enzyme R subunit